MTDRESGSRARPTAHRTQPASQFWVLGQVEAEKDGGTCGATKAKRHRESGRMNNKK
jgi:hypothetical protein